MPDFPKRVHSQFFFGLALAITALAFNACGHRAAAPITKITDKPASPTHALHPDAFAAVADKVRPAVVVVATFDEHGRLIANQHGFFISADGDLVADRTAMNKATSAVVKSSDGHAYDTFGTYERSQSPNFIVLKTNAHRVPNLEDSLAAATVPDGAPAAIVLSSIDKTRASLLEGQITGRRNDQSGEWLTFEPSPPKTAVGAPVVDATGAIIGIVAQRSESGAPAIFRYVGASSASMTDAAPENLSDESTSIPAPAEGPDEPPLPETTVAAPKSSPPPIAHLPHR